MNIFIKLLVLKDQLKKYKKITLQLCALVCFCVTPLGIEQTDCDFLDYMNKVTSPS